MNSNIPITETNQKEYGVSIKTFPYFVTITGFIQEYIGIVESKVYRFLGFNAVSSEYAARSHVNLI